MSLSNNNNKRQLATGAVFSSILLMSGVFAAPPAYDFEEEEEDDNSTLNEGERDVVDELADEWTGDDSNQDDNNEQQHLDMEQLPLEEQDSNSNIIHVKVDDHDTDQSILDPPENDDLLSETKGNTPWIDDDKQSEQAAVNDEQDTGFDDAGTLDLAEQEDTDDAEDDTAANLEDDGDDGTKAAEIETPEDSELTVEKPWDDSTSEEDEESHDMAEDNTSTEPVFDDNEQADDVEEEPATMAIDDENQDDTITLPEPELDQDVEAQETKDLDSSTAAQPTVDQQQEDDDSMINLDDYQVDNTVEEINQSLEKALDSLQQPGSIADQNERLEFANTNNFFPDENPQRYPSKIPPPIQPKTPEQEGFSVSMLFFIALSLFLLIKAPKIKVKESILLHDSIIITYSDIAIPYSSFRRLQNKSASKLSLKIDLVLVSHLFSLVSSCSWKNT